MERCKKFRKQNKRKTVWLAKNKRELEKEMRKDCREMNIAAGELFK